MILPRAAAATLLFLLLLQAATAAKFNSDGCEVTRACWMSEECADPAKPPPKDEARWKEGFYLTQYKHEFERLRPDCDAYLIVDPHENDFEYELRHSRFDKDDEVIIAFLRNAKPEQSFTCKQQRVTTPKTGFKVAAEQINDLPSGHFGCKFKVSDGLGNSNGKDEFYARFIRAFEPLDMRIIRKKAASRPKDETIIVDNYNQIIFAGRVPCSESIFLSEQTLGDEHIAKRDHNSYTRSYSCPDNYTLSRKLYYNDEKEIEKMYSSNKKTIECKFGKVMETTNDDEGTKVAQAKCARKTFTLCSAVCEGETCPVNTSEDADKRKSMTCNTSFMMLNNGAYVTKGTAVCSVKSTPIEPQWEFEDFLSGRDTTTSVNEVRCINELQCNDIYPFGALLCSNCTVPIITADGPKCEHGGFLVIGDGSQKPRKVDITCDKKRGRWLIDGKAQSGSKSDIANIRMACEGDAPPKDEPPPAAASSGNMQILAYTLGALLLLLLLVLLLWFVCCRKPHKEEPKAEPSPPAPTKTTESSVAEPISAPPPIAPEPEPETDHYWQYSGQRVQFINMSQEKLREIEPDPTMEEFSARDKTDSDRSKQSGVTDGAPTFTGPRATEQTNEKSKTVAPVDASRSDASHERSTVGEVSRTGATPKIGEPAKRNGPKVAFRDRISYETDTNTRDRSSAASMHTAPEQPQPRVDPTQKDDPSRQLFDSAPKVAKEAWSKDRTRTTQNTRDTREANDDPNRSSQDSTVGNRSRVTDVSRTG